MASMFRIIFHHISDQREANSPHRNGRYISGEKEADGARSFGWKSRPARTSEGTGLAAPQVQCADSAVRGDSPSNLEALELRMVMLGKVIRTNTHTQAQRKKHASWLT